MKRSTLLHLEFFFLGHFICTTLYSQTIYVRHDATGANDGSNWEDAYTDLQDALTVAPGGAEIWVAQGVYHPGGSSPDSTSVFTIYSSITLYGGFTGNETHLDERDPANETILSGDINEDDIPNDFVTNKSDNTWHVIYLDTLPGPVGIDGFTIKGGHTTNNPANPIYRRAGGGIFSRNTVQLSNCLFEGNFARVAGGIHLTPTASNTTVRNCQFSNNKSFLEGAGLNVFQAPGLVIYNCVFENNQGNGSLSLNSNIQTQIDSCLFLNNESPGFNAGAILILSSRDLVIRDTRFIDNSAALNGGAVTINGSQLPPNVRSNIRFIGCQFQNNTAITYGGGAIFSFNNPDITIEKCDFENNEAGLNGGAFTLNQRTINWNDSSFVRIDSCSFRDNISGEIGGAIFFDSVSAIIENSLFKGNVSIEGGHINQNCPDEKVIYRNVIFQDGTTQLRGGALACFGDNASYYFDHCGFENNFSGSRGGAIHNGSNTQIANCRFTGNHSENLGGALSQAGDSSVYVIDSSAFEFNSSAFGGAIASFAGSNHLDIGHSAFVVNQAQQGGGAIYLVESGDDNIGSLQVTSSVFGGNIASYSGSAVHVIDADTDITNCEFSYNLSNGDSLGAVLYFPKTDGDSMQVKLINNTVVFNEGGKSDGLFLHTNDTLPGALVANLQNCIFHNSNIEYFAYGHPVVNSRGGNMIKDATMAPLLMHEKDLHGTSPVFNYPDTLDFSLATNSPGINAGVTEDAPEFDILGNPRVGEVDMGAYEHQNPVSIFEQFKRHPARLTVMPNPSADPVVHLSFENEWYGKMNMAIYDFDGRFLDTRSFQKETEEVHIPIAVKHLPPGQYLVLVSHETHTLAGQLIRI